MPLNTFTLGLTIGDLGDLCGPDDLSNAVVSLRKSMLERDGGDSRWLSPISDDGIRQLIALAYYASCAAEEGRYPRFRLVSSDIAGRSLRRAADFRIPIEGVDSLRRLAPAVSETDGALFIEYCDGKLVCTGSAVISDMGFDIKIGRPEITSGWPSRTLTVRVDGPGRLRVTEAGYTLLLGHGRIQQVVDYLLVAQVWELWNQLAARMVDSTAAAYGEESRALFGGPSTLAQFIHKAWSSVLATAIDKQHGGAFVILPEDGNAKGFDIDLKYRAQMQFGEDILQFWQSCIGHAAAKNDSELGKATDRWNWRREAVFAKAGILAGLSCVDGCVVLDRNLQVLGFGGEIQVDAGKAQEAQRKLWNLRTEQYTSKDELMKMGTRHRSAFRLVKVHQGVIVFVISQDGELRIFCSDETKVFGFDRLHAWVHRYESQ